MWTWSSQPEALEAIADKAIERNIGARGLRAVHGGDADPDDVRHPLRSHDRQSGHHQGRAWRATASPMLTRDPKKIELFREIEHRQGRGKAASTALRPRVGVLNDKEERDAARLSLLHFSTMRVNPSERNNEHMELTTWNHSRPGPPGPDGVSPYDALTFDVERQISIAALERAMETDQDIFLVTQREIGVQRAGGEGSVRPSGRCPTSRQILRLCQSTASG